MGNDDRTFAPDIASRSQWLRQPCSHWHQNGIALWGTPRPLAGKSDKQLDASGFRALGECPKWVCAVTRRRFPLSASPTRQPLQPEATGAVMEVTKRLKPSDSGSQYTVTARVCRP